MLTFAFVHHPYLVCIRLFGMPSLYLFTFVMFLSFLMFILKLMLISVTARPKESTCDRKEEAE